MTAVETTLTPRSSSSMQKSSARSRTPRCPRARNLYGSTKIFPDYQAERGRVLPHAGARHRARVARSASWPSCRRPARCARASSRPSTSTAPARMNCMATRGFPTTGDSAFPGEQNINDAHRDLHRRGRHGLLLPLRPVAARPARGGPHRGRHPLPPARRPGRAHPLRPQGRHHQLHLHALSGDVHAADADVAHARRPRDPRASAVDAPGAAAGPAPAPATTGTCCSTASGPPCPLNPAQPVHRRAAAGCCSTAPTSGMDVEPVARPALLRPRPPPTASPTSSSPGCTARDVLATTVVQTCIRYDEAERCRFCAIEAVADAGSTTAVKTPAQLAEVAEAAVRLDGVRQMVMTTGTSHRPRPRRPHLARCVRAVTRGRARACRSRCSASRPATSPTISRAARRRRRLRSASTSSRSTTTCAAAGCPARRTVPLAQYRAAWAEAVRVFGRNQVSTYLLVGLGEDPDELVAGRRRARRVGVYPFVVPFRPLAGTLATDADGAAAPRPRRAGRRHRAGSPRPCARPGCAAPTRAPAARPAAPAAPSRRPAPEAASDVGALLDRDASSPAPAPRVPALDASRSGRRRAASRLPRAAPRGLRRGAGPVRRHRPRRRRRRPAHRRARRPRRRTATVLGGVRLAPGGAGRDLGWWARQPARRRPRRPAAPRRRRGPGRARPAPRAEAARRAALRRHRAGRRTSALFAPARLGDARARPAQSHGAPARADALADRPRRSALVDGDQGRRSAALLARACRPRRRRLRRRRRRPGARHRPGRRLRRDPALDGRARPGVGRLVRGAGQRQRPRRRWAPTPVGAARRGRRPRRLLRRPGPARAARGARGVGRAGARRPHPARRAGRRCRVTALGPHRPPRARRRRPARARACALTADLGGGWRPGYTGRQWDSTTHRTAESCARMGRVRRPHRPGRGQGRQHGRARRHARHARRGQRLRRRARRRRRARARPARPPATGSPASPASPCSPPTHPAAPSPPAGPATSAVCGELVAGAGVAPALARRRAHHGPRRRRHRAGRRMSRTA